MVPMPTFDAAPTAQAPLRIGLFEPDAARAAALLGLLDDPRYRLCPLGDAALALRDWLDRPVDLFLVNGFASVAAPDQLIQLCRRVAGHRPLIALTTADCRDQRTAMIAAGADDAIEPLGAGSELLVRIAALLRRHAQVAGRLACDELCIDLMQRAVWRGDRPIVLPTREFDLLATLARTPDAVVPRDQLLRGVWRLEFDPGTNSVEVHMARLRTRVDRGENFAMLRTVRGRGYVLASRNGAWSAAKAGRRMIG